MARIGIDLNHVVRNINKQIVKYYKMFEFPERFYLDKENGITSVQFNFDEEER